MAWKKPGKGFIAVLIMLAFTTVLYFACGESGLNPNKGGLDPEFYAKIPGRVTITSKVPEDTDIVLLALMDGLSAKAVYNIPDVDLDDSLETQSVPFEIEADIGEYDGIFAIWKAHNKDIVIEENIVGSYCDGGSLIPISVTSLGTQLDSANFAIDLKKVNRVAHVEGTVTFRGNWPANIENLGIVFAEPTSVLGGINVCNLLSTMDIHLVKAPRDSVGTLPFSFDVAPGTNLMVVAWNARGQSLFEPTIISDLLAGSFTVAEGDTVRNLNIIANWE